jgi:hypothetical protein
VGGVTKAPDYCFRIGGVRKFFLEAKKPAVNIKPKNFKRPVAEGFACFEFFLTHLFDEII